MNKLIVPHGLSQEEVLNLRKTFGSNELTPEESKRHWLQNFQVLKEPMILLLIITAGVYFIIGDMAEGVLIAASVIVAVSLTLYQERKSERALSALKELSSPRALVLREGKETRLPAIELVPNDIVVLQEGDRVPADAVILQCSNFTVDESLLTGESFPSKKREVSEELNIHNVELEAVYKTFANTLVVSGKAVAQIIHTGLQTEVGKIGKSLQEDSVDETSLSKEIQQMVKLFAWLGLITCSAIVLIYGLMRSDWTQALLAGLSTAMALLPEEFPVVLTVFMAIGAWRLSKVNVLIRRPGAIERLGAITILCVDKTGTLTKNQMSVSMLSNVFSFFKIQKDTENIVPEEFHEIVEWGILASHKDPFDPMEKAIHRLAKENPWGKEHLHDWELIRDYPLSEKLFAMSCVWKKSQDKDNYEIAAKGSPEAIIDLCHLGDVESQKIIEAVKSMAKEGLRVLAVARSTFPQTHLPQDQHEFTFKWIGLLGFEDPLRSEVPHAVQICRNAGIKVVMMTGDYPETALKIGKEAGLDTTSSVITGSELKTLEAHELHERLKNTHIFARMIPDQKLRIVEAFKSLGHVVAMTGDGVNDAPSLKRANVGISMGARGTDVAREASDIVLLDDHFASIVSGIERGRIIFRNIKSAMSYIVSIHIPIAGLAILPVLLNWPLILLAMHIVFLELIIDPACSIMFESQSSGKDVMKDPPRSMTDRFFTTKDLMRSILQGLLIFAVTALVYWYLLEIKDAGQLKARTMTFVVLILSNLGLIFANISGGSLFELKKLYHRTSNKIIIMGIMMVLVIGIQTPGLHDFFQVCPLSILEFFTSIAISLSIFLSLLFWNRFQR